MSASRISVSATAVFCLCAQGAWAQGLRIERDISVAKVLALRAAFSPDGGWLLVSGSTGQASSPGLGSLQLTNVKRMLVLVERRSLKVGKHLINGQPIKDIFGSDPVAFSPDGRRALAIHDDAIMAWDVENGKRVAAWGANLSAVAFSPDRRVALARKTEFKADGMQESYEAFDLGSGQSLGVFQGSGATSRMLPVDAERLYLLLVSDKQLKIRDLRKGDERIVPGVEPTDANEVASAVSADGRTLALGLKAGSVSLWDLAELKKRQEHTDLDGPVAHIALSPDGSALAFSVKSQLCVWRVAGDAVTCAEAGHMMGIGHVEFGPDSKTVATTGLMVGPTVKLWQMPAEPEK